MSDTPQIYHTTHAMVIIHGNQPRITEDPALSHATACQYGANRQRIAQLIVASDHTTPGFQDVYPVVFGAFNYHDGAIIRGSGTAAVLQTADCPVVILTNCQNGTIAVFHAGRPALTPRDHCGSCTVVENAFAALAIREPSDAARLEALVVGDICGSCFRHDHPDAEALVAPFRSMSPTVFTDPTTGALSLYEVIHRRLIACHVPADNIRREGPCTYETPGLASYRENKTNKRNTTTVIVI